MSKKVALLHDLSEGLKRGQVGQLVKKLYADVYEVEFSDEKGKKISKMIEGGSFVELI